MKWMILLLLPVFVGCGSMSTREKAWHVLHAVDVAQTIQVGKSPCHHEAMPDTAAVIGKNPSTEKVLAWGLATAVLYHYANDILPDTVMNMQFAFKVGVVANNENVGIHMDSWDCPE
jgi:hypothetical protein